ncbi:hypothetical protein D3C80_1296810 [compost metagenome]
MASISGFTCRARALRCSSSNSTVAISRPASRCRLFFSCSSRATDSCREASGWLSSSSVTLWRSEPVFSFSSPSACSSSCGVSVNSLASFSASSRFFMLLSDRLANRNSRWTSLNG